MLNSIKDEGIILSARNFRENDKILDIFLANNGVISAVAFGAKKSKKRFGGNLDPYNLANFEIIYSKKGFYLKEVSVKKIFTKIKKNIKTLTILFNLTKLLISKPLNVGKSIYTGLYRLIMKLERESVDVVKYYLFFLIYFLKKEGFISTSHCYICDSNEIKNLIYENEALLFICQKCNKLSNQSLTEEELDFLKTCLNGDKSFQYKSYKASTLSNIELLLIDYIKKHFSITLDKIEK